MNDLTLSDVFKQVVNASSVFEGRFITCEGYGNDLNTDNNNETLIGNSINQTVWKKKYPCVVLMPTREVGRNERNGTVRYAVSLYFLTGQYHDGTGGVKSANLQTNTSTASISTEWDAMEACAQQFYAYLVNLIRTTPSVVKGRVRTVKESNFLTDRFSMKQKDKVSGVVAMFEIDVVQTCSPTEYLPTWIVAEFVTLNSDVFLVDFLTADTNLIGYRATNQVYNGVDYGGGPLTTWDSPQTLPVPIQSPPWDTIPEHNDLSTGINYDNRFITYWKSLIIHTSNFVRCNPSPFHDNAAVLGYPDVEFPLSVLKPLEGISTPKFPLTYGGGLQLYFKKSATFYIRIEFYYKSVWQSDQLLCEHVLEWTELGTFIDGVFLPRARSKTYTT